METFWKNNNNGSYTFFANGKNLGTFDNTTSKKSSLTNISIANTQYKILRKGFWKTNIVILDSDNHEVLSVKPLKWYGSSYELSYQHKKYHLKIGNNPLTEWSIYEDTTLALAYALTTIDGKAGLKISGLSEAPVLFHFLLWYLIKPVIVENACDSDILLLTIAAIS